MYNLLVGGAAGQGVESAVTALEFFFKHAGSGVFTMRDLMSRIRGGHNFSRIRFGPGTPKAHSERLDGVIALNEETAAIHREALSQEGFILMDSAAKSEDPRVIRIDMAQIAKTLGNARTAGSVAVGAALKLFGVALDEKSAAEVFGRVLKPEYVGINVQAALAGYEAAPGRFTLPEGHARDMMLLSGNRAIALGALAAGVQFYAAYPMSPSTSILESLAQWAKEAGIVVEQAEDEIAAINMALGASYAGARAMTGTSGGGLSLMVEAIGLAGMTEIPVVIVDAQRPGPATGLPTRTEQSDLKFVISAAQGEFPRMVIAARGHADAFRQTIRAVNLAEKYQIPVLLLTDQYLADATASIPLLDPEIFPRYEPEMVPLTREYARYRYTDSGISPRRFPGDKEALVNIDSDEHNERGDIIEDSETRIRMMDKRMGKLKLLEKELEEPDWLGDENPQVMLVGWGSMHGPLQEAVELLNREGRKRYGALVFGDVWPLPQKKLRLAAEHAGALINVEQNYTGQLAGLIREETGIVMSASVLRYDGRQMTGEEIAQRVIKESF
ncbi:MAG: 2-oxoacid:acceptor oxidoreductase subunit alpha [Eubacteriales bacterium]|nr:2-oxoacid:acceptor oxidoreductase subunit alpha [Eubacteriales bacterium]